MLLAIALPTPSLAFDRDDAPGYLPNDSGNSEVAYPIESPEGIAPGERLRKLGLALQEFGIPEEAKPSISLPSGLTHFEDFRSRLPMMDPDGGLQRYLKIQSDQIFSFQDFVSALIPGALPDLSALFRAEPGSRDSDLLMDRLARIGARVRDPLFLEPLSGLRVVIDPGHMGTDDWDQVTGKFVQIGSRRVSEGKIALWTSLLLAQTLEDLGATVVLTRKENGTVAKSDPATFDAKPFINQVFYNGPDSWMSPYFKLADESFIRALRSSPEVNKALDPGQRVQHFIFGEDLEARARIIDQAAPEIVIVVHFDANQSDQLQEIDNSIEAFVPGGVRANETGSRILRSYHLKHLMDAERWNESVELASSMIGSMAQTLRLPLQNRPEFLTSIRVRDGVYARNLYLNRRTLNSLMVYLECLHYDHTSEFKRLALRDRVGSYQGTSFRYPRRLDSVVEGIREGLLTYLRDLPPVDALR